MRAYGRLWLLVFSMLFTVTVCEAFTCQSAQKGPLIKGQTYPDVKSCQKCAEYIEPSSIPQGLANYASGCEDVCPKPELRPATSKCKVCEADHCNKDLLNEITSTSMVCHAIIQKPFLFENSKEMYCYPGIKECFYVLHFTKEGLYAGCHIGAQSKFCGKVKGDPFQLDCIVCQKQLCNRPTDHELAEILGQRRMMDEYEKMFANKSMEQIISETDVEKNRKIAAATEQSKPRYPPMVRPHYASTRNGNNANDNAGQGTVADGRVVGAALAMSAVAVCRRLAAAAAAGLPCL